MKSSWYCERQLLASGPAKRHRRRGPSRVMPTSGTFWIQPPPGAPGSSPIASISRRDVLERELVAARRGPAALEQIRGEELRVRADQLGRDRRPPRPSLGRHRRRSAAGAGGGGAKARGQRESGEEAHRVSSFRSAASRRRTAAPRIPRAVGYPPAGRSGFASGPFSAGVRRGRSCFGMRLARQQRRRASPPGRRSVAITTDACMRSSRWSRS